MMAEEVQVKNALSLYKQCLTCYVSHLNYKVPTLNSVQKLWSLPPVVLSDIYAKMSRTENLREMLEEQLSDIDIFVKLIRFGYCRQQLFKCISTLSNGGKQLVAHIENKFLMKYDCSEDITIDPDPTEACEMEAIDYGLRLGTFLSEAGWIAQSIRILQRLEDIMKKLKAHQEMPKVLVRLDCLQRLIHSEATLCSFKSAERTYKTIGDILVHTPAEKIPKSLQANIYTQFSALFFARSEYDDSYKWSLVALKVLDDSVPEKIVIDVLRQAAKSCVVKRHFKRANILICQAMRRAKQAFGENHQKYADTLLDYGFFLLNVDSVFQSVIMYQGALSIRSAIFGDRNFHVAIVHEDLSYAYYVQEYSSGNFTCARKNIEEAVNIMKDFVPANNLKLASAKRVKALLLEEIALDIMSVNQDHIREWELLKESEHLHKNALELSLEEFGEMNVQTSKHYGNLGRLYQTMYRFDEAERMHQRAIKIKTDLLGPYDYEVGLSIGHLASLYNYHMQKYRDAEQLYLRSIEISLRLFGASYSGLEYDYLGLCHIYETLREFEKYLKYASILESWQALRNDNNAANKATYPEIQEDTSLEELTKQFFDMCGISFKDRD